MNLDARYPNAERFKFGDSRAMCDRLLGLVIAGKKTATCGALRDFEAGEPMPVVGRCDIATDWDDAPRVAIETLSVSQVWFCDVTEDFALAEGENESLEGWREDHRAYFERNGGWSNEMMLVCEEFRVVEVLI